MIYSLNSFSKDFVEAVLGDVKNLKRDEGKAFQAEGAAGAEVWQVRTRVQVCEWTWGP